MNRYRIGVVGCGRISRNHFDAIAKVEGFELTAVCDIVEARAQEAASRLGVPAFTSLNRMLEVAPLDVVAVPLLFCLPVS